MLFLGRENADRLLERLPGGAEVLLEPQTDLVGFDPGPRRLPASSEWARSERVPEEGVWYALFTGSLERPFGVARAGSYTVREYPGRTFPLGAHGRLGVSAAHVLALEPLLRVSGAEWRSSLNLAELLQALMPRLRTGLGEAAAAVNGPGACRYERLRAALPELEDALYKAWFHVFYDAGFLLEKEAFHLGGITEPTIIV